MLKMTKVELKLITYSDRFIFLKIKKGQELEFLIFLIDIAKSTTSI